MLMSSILVFCQKRKVALTLNPSVVGMMYYIVTDFVKSLAKRTVFTVFEIVSSGRYTLRDLRHKINHMPVSGTMILLFRD